MELLVRRRRGPDDVVVDPPLLDRREDRVSRLAVAPVAPADEQRALRVRMGLPHLAEQVAPGAVLEPLAGEDERDVLAGGVDLGELATSLVGRGDADDAVVALVPVAKLPLDALETLWVRVHGEDDGRGHCATRRSHTSRRRRT